MSMRIAPAVAFVLAASFVAGCALAQLTQGGPAEQTASDGGTEGGAAEAGILGAGCGIEGISNTQLCLATSACPTVVVDAQSFPHCGFRIKGGTSELVCACGAGFICSMGPFTTCAQAAQLLVSQTEASVCVQVGEDRCTAAVPVAGSSGSSGSGSGSTCDRQCLKECGGGAGCASLCGC